MAMECPATDNVVIAETQSTSQKVAETSDETDSSIGWKKQTKSMFLVQQLVRKGISPRHIMSLLYPMYFVPSGIPDVWILQLLRELCEQNTRERLPQFSTFADAVELIRKSKRIMLLTGAGVSVSCGIPDFRSENGVYARLRKDFPELPDPHSMFDIEFFSHNPAPFYNFAREIFPGQFRPSVSHMFIKFLEEEGKLLRNYTQNIDTLERVAGIHNLVECHGSFARSTCLSCGHEIDSEEIRKDIMAQRVPHCSKCKVGVLKPNIVFFGEDLGDAFHTQMSEDHGKVDLLVVVGSSLQVRPVSTVPYNIAPEVPQILINREVLPKYHADIKLLGNCDQILALLALAIGGEMRAKMAKELESRGEQNNILPELEEIVREKLFFPQQLTVNEFKRQIGAENGDEPEAKKSRIVSNGKEEESQQQADAKLWEGNYVLCESQLPNAHSALFVPPNLNVFRGAKLFYDRDQDTFVHRTGIKQQCEDDEDQLEYEHRSSSSSSTDDSSSSDERGGSLPPRMQKIAEVEEEKEEADSRRKGASCPPEHLGGRGGESPTSSS